MLVHTMDAPRLDLRPPSRVCDPSDLGGARSTRHSFSRQLIREITTARWSFARTEFDLDDLGRGTAAYEVRVAADNLMTLVLFSQVIGEDARTDRVIAETWDVTGALIDGRLSPADIAELRPQVTAQEEGRALPGTIIWGRANRSVRFFDRVVDDLAAGRQPDPDAFGLSPYLLRSTAFYSNGKFGMRDFESFTPDHALSVPYRAHMLAAWLFREFSYDLVEHCARAENPDAAVLEGGWARYFGLGNATGLGLVPYVINHPEILDTWLWSREYPLAVAMARQDAPGSDSARRVVALLEHFLAYLAEQGEDVPAPFSSGADLARSLAGIRDLAEEYLTAGTMRSVLTTTPWQTLHDAAEALGPEIRGIVATVITELTEHLDAEVQAALVCTEDRHVDPGWRIDRLRTAIIENYAWVGAFDFTAKAQTDRFWFTSATSEEPRRGDTETDPGFEVQHGVNIAEEIQELARAVKTLPREITVAQFLLAHPQHRAAVSRVQKVGPLRYGEIHANLRSSRFLPLNPQRVQLAVYGMENFNPQSTDWLRVTLLSGAPRLAEVNAGTKDDTWMFPLRPNTTGGGVRS